MPPWTTQGATPEARPPMPTCLPSTRACRSEDGATDSDDRRHRRHPERRRDLGRGRNWGYRTSTLDGASWATMLNPEQANDHSPDLLRDVAVGGGVVIAVGGDRNSMVMRSTDGVTWEEDLHPEGRQWLGGVAYGDGRWVAGGGVGTTVTSTDGGRTWSDGARAPSAVRDVAFGDGLFVAVGDGGMIATTTDASTWTDRRRDGAVTLSTVAFHAGLWIAAGSNWNGSGFDTDCFLSNDTETWRACPFESRVRTTFVSGGTLYVALDDGHAWTRDGATWSTETLDLPSHGVYVEDGLWVGAGGDRRYAGEALDALSSTTGERGLRAFAFGHLAP
ncbi:MAG: hypothetical protein R3B99_14360 [Polyangiales bacterium]